MTEQFTVSPREVRTSVWSLLELFGLIDADPYRDDHLALHAVKARVRTDIAQLKRTAEERGIDSSSLDAIDTSWHRLWSDYPEQPQALARFREYFEHTRLIERLRATAIRLDEQAQIELESAPVLVRGLSELAVNLDDVHRLVGDADTRVLQIDEVLADGIERLASSFDSLAALSASLEGVRIGGGDFASAVARWLIANGLIPEDEPADGDVLAMGMYALSEKLTEEARHPEGTDCSGSDEQQQSGPFFDHERWVVRWRNGEPTEAIRASEVLWNRVLGRPPQAVVATDEDGNALPLDLRRLALEAVELEIVEMMAPAVRAEAERLVAEGVVPSAGGNGRVARKVTNEARKDGR